MTLLKQRLLMAFAVLSLAWGGAAMAAEAEDIVRMQQFLGVMEGYYSIINGVHEVARDPEKSAILQLQKIEEIYKSRGDRAESIAILREVVERTTSAAIRNAASVMLADALNETGRASEAIEVLRSALDRNL